MKKYLILGLLFAIGVLVIWGWGLSADKEPNQPSTPSMADTHGIIINEVMSSNKGIFPDNNGFNSDWVELYNTTDQDINMENYFLSDNAKKPGKWLFPNITLKAHEYMVIFLSGESNVNLKDGVIHCTFKLNSQGEDLTLFHISGTEIDKVNIPSLPDNISYSYANGVWQQTSEITPGFANNEEGHRLYKEAMIVQDPSIIINEVMVSNGITISDNTCAYSDWVEIKNIGQQEININGYGLSDDTNDPLKWKFPDITLIPGETLLVFCSGITLPYDSTSTLNADFKLSSLNSTVTLSDACGHLMDNVLIEETPTDWSYARIYQDGVPSDDWWETSMPTPGYDNTDSGFADFQNSHQLLLGDIVISEVLPSNNQFDFKGQTSDFIEIENRGESAVNLEGYGLTDNAGNPSKYRFPDITLQPEEQIVVLASGADAELSDASYLVAQFKLNRLGSTIALFNAQDQLLDRYFIGTLPQNVSIGREGGATQTTYFDKPTPGMPNIEGKTGFVSEVLFSQKPGIYSRKIEVALSCFDKCDIYYTIEDGKTPSQNAIKYVGPISIDKTTVIRAKAYRDGYIESGTSTATYFIDPSHTLPLLSVVTDEENLFDPVKGIYMLGPNAAGAEAYYDGANFYSDTEVPASFEVFDEAGKRVFNQNIALRMAGGLSQMREQKSFAVFARSQYGSSTMEYSFFEDRSFTEYKSILLRNGGRDKTKINEAVAIGLVEEKMNVLTQAIKPYVLYINGEYWGVYYMMEKRNKYMFAAHEGIDSPDNMNILTGSGISNRSVLFGSNEEYKEIIQFIKNNDMSIKENFNYVASRIDTNSFMDEMINEIWVANNDMGNMQFYQILPNGKWKQVYYDFCITFGASNHNFLSDRMLPNTTGSTLFNGLLSYKPWRDQFIQRFAWALENIYHPDHVAELIMQAADAIAGEIATEHALFNSNATVEEWDAGVNDMLYFAKTRGKAIVQHLKSTFDLTEEQQNMLDNAVK